MPTTAALPLDRAIADRLAINRPIAVWARSQFAAACDAVLMSELSAMTPAQRIDHAAWFSTGPVVTGAEEREPRGTQQRANRDRVLA